MKRRYCPLLFLAIYFYACDHRKVVSKKTSPDYAKAQSFLSRKPDSAFYYFNKFATGSKDSLSIATAYTNMAMIQADRGDYYGSQETLLSSLKYLNERKKSNYGCFMSDYNQLGRNSSDLKNYDAAIGYYDLAMKFSSDERLKAIALNNQAVAYGKLRKYDQAIAIYESIIGQSKKTNRDYARVLTNLAMVKWQQDPVYRAAPELLSALRIRQIDKDDWGLNSSYAHLADYYTTTRPDSALFYADKMYAMAQRLGSPDDELEALQKLILLGGSGEGKNYFTRYLQLNDSLQTARNSAKNQFALIRYEAEKNKADNLRLEQENAEKRGEILRERVALFSVIATFVFVVGWLVVWFKGRIQNHRLKTLQKVHDVVANGLYRIMTWIEHHMTMDREWLLDQLEILYEQSRNISYERADPVGGDFQSLMADVLGAFSGGETRVLVVGNEKTLWDVIPTVVKQGLLPVLQELMTNMRKHSHAGNVVVRFGQAGDQLMIHYADDGVGFKSGLSFGNGLTNTGNRIKEMGGRITFGRNIPKGLKIEICIPNSYVQDDQQSADS